MKRKLLGRVSAVAMASAMMVSMFGMSVSAAGVTTGDDIDSVNYTKIVNTDGNTYAPNTTFKFEVSNGEAGTLASDGENENVVYVKGVTGGLTAGNGVTFTPSGSTPQSSYSQTGTLGVNAGAFEEAGVYHYVVKEAATNYEGIVIGGEEYDVYLYVYSDKDDLYVGNVVAMEKDTTTKADLNFTNDYGADEEENDSTHDVTITKNITGNMANMADTFHFDVTVNGANGEWYKVVVKENAEDQNGTEYHIVSGTPATYEIGHGGTIQIFGLTETDSYSVSEQEAGHNGYTTTVSGDATSVDNKTVSGSLTADDTNITYTNNKATSTPTGIIMNIAPYIVLLAFAAVAALFFLRRRNNREF